MKNTNSPLGTDGSKTARLPDKQVYQLSGEAVAKQLNASTTTGLTRAEARARLRTYGPNRISAVRETPWWLVLLRQFWSPLVGILVVAAGLSYWYGEREESNNLIFYTLLSAQLWHVFNMPDAGSSLFNNVITKNKYVWFAILLCLGFTGIAYTLTSVREMLGLGPVTDWLTVFIPLFLGLVPVLIIRLLKLAGLLGRFQPGTKA